MILAPANQPSDDPFVEPGSSGPICGALEKSIKAAENHAKEACKLFGNIFSYLDDHWATPSRTSLTAKQRPALKNLCADLAAVVSRHFDAYINETPPASYANIARQGPENRITNSQLSRNNGPDCSGPQSQPQPQSQRHRTDDRLFIRIPVGDKLRDLSAYAIQYHLKAKLEIDGRLLTNLQSTKTGFGLCPKNGDTVNFKETISKVNIFRDALMEIASPWTSYRIKNVPRTFGTINDKLVYFLQPVTAAAMHATLSAAVGVAPVVISPSRDNEADSSSSFMSWIVRSQNLTNIFPHILYLSRCRTFSRILPRQHLSANSSTGLTRITSLLSPIDEATHNRGNVLDLAFGSCSLIAKSHCAVASHLDTNSDHAPLLTMVDWIEHNVPQRKLRPDTLDSALFNHLLFISINQLAPLPLSPNSDSLDILALGLTDAIRLAYSGSARRTLGPGKGNPWWDISCKSARQRYKSITKVSHTEEDFIEVRNEYHKTIKKAKNKFFLAQASKASTAKDIFNISKWHKQGFQTTLAEKREIFAANLLVNLAEAGDIPLDAPSVSVRTLPFPPLSRQEVRDNLLKAGNTAPGLDEIPTAILGCAWPLVADLVHSLFSGCISLGYHPHYFRQAILIMIQIPNKSDLSSPRAFRLIALISVLGKDLERLLAKRMS
ncbi:hypothetical protein K3495_g597 [Podosphaera aphanis]|nr:hypothetical protein K3495_g597 [Podosphaera aphanis]